MSRFGGAFFCLFSLCWPTGAFAQTTGSVTAASVRSHIIKLADDKLEGRGAGYRGEKMAADHIASQFKSIGLRPAVGKSFFQEFRFHAFHPTKPWQIMTSRNVLGVLDGADPALKKEVVVIGAHYDGQGMTGQADPTRNPAPAGSAVDNIWNSANDNAASVAAIIEIARALKNAPQRPKRTILFALFGAEEHGMTGSIYYVNNPIFPINDHVAMINLEKLGRSPERPFAVMGTMSSKAWPEIVNGAGGVTGTKLAPSPIAFPDSDHYPFGSRGIPAVMILVMSPAHNPDDHADTINFERTAEGARYALAVVRTVADRPQRPDFVASPMLDPGLIAHLLTPAESETSKLDPGKGGLKVTGVIKGLPADRSGFKEGDIILSMGTRTFAREEPLSVLMAGFQDLLQGKLGVSIPMKISRAGKPMDMTLNLRP